MNQIWIIVAAVVGVLIFTRIRSRRRQPKRRPPSAGPRIQGYQVNACLHPRMSAACLYDHGLQFGKGFRRKEGPALPHDAQCRCETVAFSFTSSEVFNGALRNLGATKSTVDGLAPAEATRLVERLKAVEAAPLPSSAETYVDAMDVTAVASGIAVQEALRGFLAERYAYLRETSRNGTAPAPDGAAQAPADPKSAVNRPRTSDGMETA